METARICKNEREVIFCERGDVLDIVEASYGRSSNFAWCGFSFTEYCHATESLEIVQELCQHKRSCSLYASNDVFGNPCPTIRKYLKVVYSCIPENTTAENPVLATREKNQTLPVAEAVTSLNTVAKDNPTNYGVIFAVVAAVLVVGIIILSLLLKRRCGCNRKVSKKSNAEEVVALNHQSPRASTTTEPQYEEINEALKSEAITPTAPSVGTVDCEQKEHIVPFLDDEAPSNYLIVSGSVTPRDMGDDKTTSEETAVKRVRE